MKHLRKILLTGLFVLAPIIATLSIVAWVFNAVDRIFRIPLERWIGFPLVGIGIILTFFFIFLTGLISTNILGKKIIVITETVLRKIPLVNTVFISIKQLIDTFFTGHKNTFKYAVAVQYPRQDIYAIGFVTADAPTEISDKTGRALKSIFIPTTPNPTSGMFVMMPVEDILFLDMSVEAAVKLIVSGGILLPEKNLPHG